jgi:hypothetical protein
MKQLIKIIILSILLSNCSSSRYVLNDLSKNDRRFLITEIKKAKAINKISSSKPIIVVDGKPHRFNYELKENKLELSKVDIKNIEILKHDVGIKMFGDFAKNGVFIITTKEHKKDYEDKKEEKLSLDNANILFLVDAKVVTKEYVTSIDPNMIETITVLKGEAAKKLYPDRNLDGVIIIVLKK